MKYNGGTKIKVTKLIDMEVSDCKVTFLVKKMIHFVCIEMWCLVVDVEKDRLRTD